MVLTPLSQGKSRRLRSCHSATKMSRPPIPAFLHFWVFNILTLTLLYRFSFLLMPGVSEKPSSSERLSRKEGRILLPTSCPLSRLERRRRTTSWSVGGNRLMTGKSLLTYSRLTARGGVRRETVLPVPRGDRTASCSTCLRVDAIPALRQSLKLQCPRLKVH